MCVCRYGDFCHGEWRAYTKRFVGQRLPLFSVLNVLFRSTVFTGHLLFVVERKGKWLRCVILLDKLLGASQFLQILRRSAYDRLCGCAFQFDFGEHAMLKSITMCETVVQCCHGFSNMSLDLTSHDKSVDNLIIMHHTIFTAYLASVK